MAHLCPACQRAFDEPGFCPFDGTQLVHGELPPTVKPTLLSDVVQAQTGDTLPNTNVVRAVSATEGHAAALASFAERETTSEYDKLVGQTLDGRYFVQRKLGEGGMGVVFAAKHAVIERPLAIKVLKREVMRDTATIRRFVQEAKAASRIGHPNIVDVTDFGTTPEGMTYSVMEFVDGETLGTAIKKGAPLPADRAIRIAAQIARALGAAHDKGIVHRDLKPENVFLIARDDRPDFVKIVDFGIAKVQPLEGTEAGPRLTRAGSVFGTPEYMAPEQAAGRSDTDRRVDIYALGTILYEMLVGKTPHKSESTIRTIAKQMLDPIVPPSQVNPDLAISSALEAVVMRALAKKREDRYATMTEFVNALEEIAASPTEPMLSLPALPPGADAQPTTPGLPRRQKPETRQLHEPEFVAAGSLSLEAAFGEPPEVKPARRRWPLVVLGVFVVLAGAGGAIEIVRHAAHRDEVIAVRDDAAPARPDATRIVAAADATVDEPTDAAVIAELPADAGVHRVPRDAGIGLLHPKTIRIEVLTKPGEAHIFVDGHYRGPTSTTLEEPYGVKREVDCKTDDYMGSVVVVFDGSRSSVWCNAATKIPPCVPGLRNPYRNCPNSMP